MNVLKCGAPELPAALFEAIDELTIIEFLELTQHFSKIIAGAPGAQSDNEAVDNVLAMAQMLSMDQVVPFLQAYSERYT